MPLRNVLADHIHAVTGEPFIPTDCKDIGGGCINKAVVVTALDGRRYFAKFNDAERLPMFEAESEGLTTLAQTGAIRVPRPVCTGRTSHHAFLVMEYLKLNRAGETSQAHLGTRLARLHRASAPQFGWHRNNTIGSTSQINDWHDDWIVFYRERRLRVQIDLAADRGEKELCRLGETLMEALPDFFGGYRPVVSLLHGDLWSGNVSAVRDGEPVIFDPAVYYGDREADVAMTELFGGFSAGFYAAYREAWPLDPGYATRKSLYNLYHVLNHFNLFGGGYGAQAEHTMRQLLSQRR